MVIPARAMSAALTFALLFFVASRPAIAQQGLVVLSDRVPAPSLSGAGEWLNCEGPLDLPELRGKFVILDFWTYCCINCMHVLPELKKLEEEFPQHLVVIGVHSPKFAAERDPRNVMRAIERYEVEHPVVCD
jgi:thiol-disulfide isomerase/thioredoxin